MGYGIIGVPGNGDITQPSPSIWGDCANGELLDEGLGYFTDKTFEDAVTLPDLPNSAANSGTFTQDANFDHALLLTTGATSGNGNVVYTRPTVAITPGSGQKAWMEAIVSMQDITEVSGIFVGFVNKIGMTNALVQAASATKNSNLLTSVQSTSCVGFWMHGDALGNFDAVYVNNVANTSGVTPSAVSVVLASVMTANANNPDPGNPLYVPAGAPGVLANNTKVKLGLRYDGQQYLYFYVNGVQLAKLLVSAQNIDITSTYGAVVALTTGAAAAHHLDVHRFRNASKLF
jgi:hypothetical protein